MQRRKDAKEQDFIGLFYKCKWYNKIKLMSIELAWKQLPLAEIPVWDTSGFLLFFYSCLLS